MNKPPYTEEDAIRDAQARADRERATIHVYLRIAMGAEVWYVRAAEALPPYGDAALYYVAHPQARK